MTCIERCQGYMVENHWLKIIYNMHSAQLVHALSEYWGLTTNSELCYSFPTKLHKMSMQINLISFCSVWLLCLVYHMSVYWNYLNSLVLTIPIFNKLFVNINLNSYIPSFLFYIFTKLEKTMCILTFAFFIHVHWRNTKRVSAIFFRLAVKNKTALGKTRPD